jgi:type II secretory pathway predicted ATPase ExeA
MTRKLLSVFGLKWNPFLPDVPTEAIWTPPRIEHFVDRLEHQVSDGGFALITGDPGTGKSVTLRLLAERIGRLPDVVVGVLTRPQSGVSDFYRELGQLFGVSLAPSNRWGAFRALRERWQAHIDSSLLRPVLLIDEAQEIMAAVFCELRILASTNFDSRNLLTVVLAGDGRLVDKLHTDDLLPLGSRVRSRLALSTATPQELLDFLRHALAKAGNARLMTPELMQMLADHGAGNPRVLCGMAADLLAAGAERELRQLDEKLYFEIFAQPTSDAAATRTPRGRKAR